MLHAGFSLLAQKSRGHYGQGEEFNLKELNTTQKEMANKVSNQANAKASHDITLPDISRAWTSIIRPVVAANIFELKLALIQMA